MALSRLAVMQGSYKVIMVRLHIADLVLCPQVQVVPGNNNGSGWGTAPSWWIDHGSSSTSPTGSTSATSSAGPAGTTGTTHG